MHRSLSTCLLAAAALGACSTADAPASLDGRYVLQTVNSAALPFDEGRDQMGGLVSLVANTLWLRLDGTFTDAAHLANSYDAGTAMTENVQRGTWSGANGSIRFVDASNAANMYLGSLSGGTLTEATPGFTQVFVRR